MNENVDSADTGTGSQAKRRFVKSAIPNLFILEPSEIYYGRVKVGGKTLKNCLDTTSFTVAKKRLKVWLDEVREKATNDAKLGALSEEYLKRLQLQVVAGDIKPRTLDTKLESLDQIQKIWQELFSTGKIDPNNYAQGGNHAIKLQPPCPLFTTQKISQVTQPKLDRWRASMTQAYSPSRVNGGMTVFGELLDPQQA